MAFQHLEQSLFVHSINRIGREVHQDLVELYGIGFDGTALRIKILPDLNGRGNRGTQQCECFSEYYLGFDRHQVLFGFTAEGKDLVNQ